MSAPEKLTYPGEAAAVKAALTTNHTGNNNDSKLTAKTAGSIGNLIRLRLVTPGANNAALSVVVAGLDITVNLATGGGGAVTTTGTLFNAAINNDPAASALVGAANAPGNDGTGLVVAMAYAPLTGGLGGQPGPPEPLTWPAPPTE